MSAALSSVATNLASHPFIYVRTLIQVGNDCYDMVLRRGNVSKAFTTNGKNQSSSNVKNDLKTDIASVIALPRLGGILQQILCFEKAPLISVELFVVL